MLTFIEKICPYVSDVSTLLQTEAIVFLLIRFSGEGSCWASAVNDSRLKGEESLSEGKKWVRSHFLFLLFQNLLGVMSRMLIGYLY